MTEDTSNPESPRAPGERRLARPPSERYREQEAPPPDEVAGSPARAALFGLIGAVGSAGILTVLGGVFAFSAGLVAIAGLLGWAIARGVRLGGGPPVSASVRTRLSAAFAALAVLGGQLGLWLYARSEGGVLGPLDYLGETFGVLIPIQLVVAVVVGWASAR